jgi:hypothetical protein
MTPTHWKMNSNTQETFLMTSKLDKSNIAVYHSLVEFVASKLDTFTSSDVRLLAEAKQNTYPEVDKPSQWGNILRSAQSQNICRPLDVWVKSRYKGTNAAPRILWTGIRRKKTA